jgi:hypothetical protein
VPRADPFAERQFIKAAGWSLAAALLSAVGIIHVYDLTPGGVTSRFGWLACAGIFYRLFVVGPFVLARGDDSQEKLARISKHYGRTVVSGVYS